jgi:hypothetical protein
MMPGLLVLDKANLRKLTRQFPSAFRSIQISFPAPFRAELLRQVLLIGQWDGLHSVPTPALSLGRGRMVHRFSITLVPEFA